jgi:carboxylesterase type B
VPLINGITLHDGAVTWSFKSDLETIFNARGNTSFSGSALGVALPAVTSTERLLTTQYLGRWGQAQAATRRTWAGSLEENQDAITDLHTDALFASPASQVRCLGLCYPHGKVSTLHGRLAPVYNYILAARCNDFSFGTFFGVPNITAGLVAHADDIPCIFKPDGQIFGGVFKAQSEEQAKISRAMTRAWTNFAKYLDPAPRPGSPGSPWPPGGAVMLLKPEPELLDAELAGAQPYQAMADRWSCTG